jgi:hypothetical protein
LTTLNKELQKRIRNLSISLRLVRRVSKVEERSTQEADMARQDKTSRTLKSIMGAALAGLVLVILSGRLGGPSVQLPTLLCAAEGEALELLPSIVSASWQALQAYAFDHQRTFPCPLQMLVSFWPLLRVMARAA